MKLTEYMHDTNKKELRPTKNTIVIGRGYYSEHGSDWPFYPVRDRHTVKGKPWVYSYPILGYQSETEHRRYIALNWFENIRFRHIQRTLWVYKAENIMWFINIMVAILAVIAAFKQAAH